ncbi:MAG: FHA domain-containing protein, partial [Lachnospiraceae bacterium]|nr:FHA domain-containing protein [Lachnospiraceae bacterium]
VIACAVCAAGETIIFLIGRHRRKKRKLKTMKSAYKLMEGRVLEETLKNRITNEQASAREYQSLFLRVEFPDTKPWLANVFALDESITIGRSRENKISIRDPGISRLHCKITLISRRLYLQDLGSANGTIVRHGLFRKSCLSGQQVEQLENGDRIMLGNYRMKITVFYGREAAENHMG